MNVVVVDAERGERPELAAVADADVDRPWLSRSTAVIADASCSGSCSEADEDRDARAAIGSVHAAA